MPKVRAVGFSGQDHPGATLLPSECLDARPDRALEHVVRQQDHASIPGDKFLGETEGFGDTAGLVLVRVEEAVDAELVSVAQQAQELAGVRAPRHQHDLADARPD